MAQRVTVRERIDPAITASLFANYRSSADAVMELVDNAIDSRLKGTPLDILVQVHSSYFVIETRGGEGMGPAELERHYLRWGGSPKRGRNLLGQYGQGGKAAVGHLGGSFTVEASRPGDKGHSWRPSQCGRCSMRWAATQPQTKDRGVPPVQLGRSSTVCRGLL